MRRLHLALAALAVSPCACKSKQELPEPERRSPPLEQLEIAAGTAEDVRALAAAEYARSLEAQLDLVPPDADAYLVIRDLRPLIGQARRVEQVMAGPLARAIPALAKIGGGSGEARLAQLTRARELLALILAGLEGSGVALEQGLVVVQGRGEPAIVFAAEDLARLGALAELVGASVDLGQSCAALTEQPGWFVCSLGGAEGLAGYRPAKQGAALAKRLGDRLAGVELGRVNLAISMAQRPTEQEPASSFDLALRTDPGLWELSTPLASPEGQRMLAVGPAPALRALVPGTSFVWGRFEPAHFQTGEVRGPIDPGLLTGEAWFGAVDDPDGFAAQAGITDASEVAKAIQAAAALLPADALSPEALADLRVELDRASIELDGLLVPSLGMTATGDGAEAWAETLGVDPRARIWAYGDYLSAAVGEVQAIPAALGRLEGRGPSPAAIAAMPPTLARSLLADEVGLVMHVVLDHWQAPPSEAELHSLLAGVPPDRRPAPAGITALFQALAPWSSATVWLRRTGPYEWIANVSLVPFAVADGPEAAQEAAAAAAVLDEVLGGGDGQAGYRELLAKYPSSPRAYAYRARLGEAPAHHAAAGTIEVGLVAALAIPAIQDYLARAKAAEAVEETAAILSAALAVRERTGSCEALLGEAGPTPPLSVSCHAEDRGRCRPSSDKPAGEGEYPLAAWTDDPVWAALGYRPFRVESGHRYHYAFTAEATADGCHVRVRAFGDVDGDGVFSTHEREATLHENGDQTLTVLRVEHGDE